ncbi:MAG: phenylacetate--CoA ligase family protein [Taibaiella sp.]|nr:phenylacetate--CoA ligase family protein [Taibaiella sp.]
MAFLQQLYKRTPVFFQNVMVSAYGYGWRKKRFGGNFKEELKAYKERESFTTPQWDEYQTHELRKTLLHAFETVPFYKEKYTRAGITAEQLKNIQLSDIAKLPYLEKDEVRKYGDTILLSSQKQKGEFHASSGSTGTPSRIYYSPSMHQQWSAGFEARIRHWAGVDRYTPRGMIGGRRVLPDSVAKGPYYRYNLAEKQVYFSAYHISAHTAPEYVKAIRRHKLEYMTGYAMSNYFLAHFIEEAGISTPQLKAVITSSEKLTDEMRATFKNVYGCKTYDSWSGVEACGLISECEMGSLHMSPDMALLEVLDEQGNPVGPGGTGELVCTGFLNYDQPLIRYRIGDRITLSEQDCSCGRKMTVVKEIAGRIEDIVIGRDGRKMVRFHGIFINIPSIAQGQIIQESTEHIVIRVVITKQLSAAERALIIQRMTSQLGDIRVDIEEVSEIPLTANGKFKAVISKLKQ